MFVPLYCQRKVLNWEKITEFYSKQGVIPIENLHVTLAYSRRLSNLNSFVPKSNELTLTKDSKRKMLVLGSTLALGLNSKALHDEFDYFIKKGCSYDFPSYIPHVSIFETPTPEMFNLIPFTDAIVLGPQEISELKE